MSSRRKPVLSAVVLAAGRSTRFRTGTPKVLHPVAGRALVRHVLETLRELHRTHKLRSVVLVVPPGGAVQSSLDGVRFPFDVVPAVQRQPKGTGDAARVGLSKLDDADEVLVLAGDMPLVTAPSLARLVDARRPDAAGSLLYATLDDAGSFGRVLREDGWVTAVVEQRDATPEQLAVRDANACIYAFDRGVLAKALPRLRASNAQAEYYLTDVVGEVVRSGDEVVAVDCEPDEAIGVNTRAEQARVAAVLRERTLDRLFDSGVSVVDPATTYVDAGIEVGSDTVLLPNTFLEGETRVGAGCEIGPNVRLVDSAVADGARVTFAVVRGSRIGSGAEVGPFASLRPGTVLRKDAKVGTFVETKAADIGEGTKVPHLSYMGDVRIGSGTNIGAGTITCNYDPFRPAADGSSKHRTWIGDDVHVSSDTMLVAPVRVGHRSQTGAGSVVTRNVGDDELVYGVPATPRGPSKKKPKRAKGTR